MWFFSSWRLVKAQVIRACKSIETAAVWKNVCFFWSERLPLKISSSIIFLIISRRTLIVNVFALICYSCDEFDNYHMIPFFTSLSKHNIYIRLGRFPIEKNLSKIVLHVISTARSLILSGYHSYVLLNFESFSVVSVPSSIPLRNPASFTRPRSPYGPVLFPSGLLSFTRLVPLFGSVSVTLSFPPLSSMSVTRWVLPSDSCQSNCQSLLST